MKIRTRFRRIGITGSARAGKTVFLLSLINHFEAGDLRVEGGETRRFRRRLPWTSPPPTPTSMTVPGTECPTARRPPTAPIRMTPHRRQFENPATLWIRQPGFWTLLPQPSHQRELIGWLPLMLSGYRRWQAHSSPQTRWISMR